jgi:4a-hydroxytetrahydrobiopterin dehydratase
MEKLSPEEIERRCTNSLGLDWAIGANQLTIHLSLHSEHEVNQLLKQLDHLAELQRHHPDVAVKGQEVTISLTTHDAAGITVRDFRYAEALEAYLNS